MALKAVGRTIQKLGSSKFGVAAVAGTGIMAGVANTAGPATMDATMDVAFGTPDADRYFTGRDMSLRGTIGAAMGGFQGGALLATAPGDQFALNPAIVSPAATIPIGMAAGAFAFGRKGSIKSRILKGGLGAMGGGIVGAGISGLGLTSYISNNQQFFAQSPYAPSAARAYADLNATGDVVLGMHNARRGY